MAEDALTRAQSLRARARAIEASGGEALTEWTELARMGDLEGAAVLLCGKAAEGGGAEALAELWARHELARPWIVSRLRSSASRAPFACYSVLTRLEGPSSDACARLCALELAQARRLLDAGDDQEAEGLLRAVLGRGADQAAAAFEAAVLLGEFDLAAELGDAAAARDEMSLLSLASQGRLEHARKRHLELLRTRREQNPWSSFLAGTLGQELSDFSAALADRAPRRAWMRAQIAREHLSRGLTERALALLEEAIAQNPRYWRARGLLAEARLFAGRPEAAFEALDAAEAVLSKDHVELACWRGELCLWLGRYPEALGLLDRASAGGAGWSHCWRGAAKLRLGRTADARADLERALAYEPDDAEASIWLAEAQRLSGDAAGAAALLEPRKNNTWALCNAVLALLDLGRGEEARACLNTFPRVLAAELGLDLASDPRRLCEAALALARGYRRADPGGPKQWAGVLPIILSLRR